MAAQQILRVTRLDVPDSFVLVNSSRTGKSQLSFKLVATEGEKPYVGSITQSLLGDLRAKNYQGSDEEWADILAHVFGSKRKHESSPGDWASGLEVIAKVEKVVDSDRNELVITLRKRIDGITQKLGSITLEQDDDQSIELFEWNGIAVSRANDLENNISSLMDKYRAAEETIAKLNAQLENLVQAKNDHDDQLIAKFVQLLNEKKLKIRNQQRLLASANIDTSKVAELDEASEARNHSVHSSRRGKRKAIEEELCESEKSDGFDRMSVIDGAKQERGAGENDETARATDSDRQSTPEPLEDETPRADEDDDEDEEPKAPLSSRKGIEVGSNNSRADRYDGEEEPRSLTRSRRAAASATQKPGSSKQTKAKTTETPPPRRELPFSTRRAAKRGAGSVSHVSPDEEKSPQPEPNQTLQENDGEDTGGETDDDEL